MRINVYQEEMGEGVEVVQTVSKNGEHFYGLRVWLKSPESILDHSTAEDDDRCAVTFWSNDGDDLRDMITQMRDAMDAFEVPKEV